MIEFDHVSKVYEDGTEAVKDFTLQINEGEIFTLIGPSGCGKTTTMKMVNRLVKPTKGTIRIGDKDIKDYDMHQLRWNIGYVLQQIALFPHMSIEENIVIVPEMKKWKKTEIKERIKVLLDMVGLEPSQFMKRMPHELSGGQQQRIGVVRALAADPDIILMDEPFSALDPISREQLQNDIRDLQKKIQKTIVFVTHDMDEALAISDRICLMKEGEIIQIGTPKQLILQPENEFARTFIGDKRSPWQETIEEVLLHTTQSKVENNDKNKGRITHDQAVVEAVKLFEDNNTTTLQVVKGEQIIGEIRYQDILRFLRKYISIENGVMK